MSVELLRALIRETMSEISEAEKGHEQDGPGRPPEDPDNALRNWMEEEGETADDLARELDVTPSTVNKYARGEVTPPLQKAVKIKKLYNIPFEYWAK